MARCGFDIFISYKRKQRDAARWLADALKAQGYTVWWDADLIVGGNYITIINEVIQSSRLCIVLWDKEATRSEYVLSEAVTAQNKGGYAPFVLEDVNLPPPFTASHAESLKDWNTAPEAARQRAITSIQRGFPKEEGGRDEDALYREINEWLTIEKSRDKAKFEGHILRHGDNGIFGELALDRIQTLSLDETPQAPAVASTAASVPPQQALVDSLVTVSQTALALGTDEADERVPFPEERPMRSIQLAPFRMSRDLVTFDQYDAFCAVQGMAPPDDGVWGRGNMPVINISKTQARAFCDWLSAETGTAVRLPLEAEWECAARGGTQTLFTWGDEWATGWCNGAMETGRTTPVGQFDANHFGLRDMIGNVWEYCADDWHDSHETVLANGQTPRGDPEEATVIKGGAFDSSPIFLRPAMRWSCCPNTPAHNIGFRIAADG